MKLHRSWHIQWQVFLRFVSFLYESYFALFGSCQVIYSFKNTITNLKDFLLSVKKALLPVSVGADTPWTSSHGIKELLGEIDSELRPSFSARCGKEVSSRPPNGRRIENDLVWGSRPTEEPIKLYQNQDLCLLTPNNFMNPLTAPGNYKRVLPQEKIQVHLNIDEDLLGHVVDRGISL